MVSSAAVCGEMVPETRLLPLLLLALPENLQH
jgi:hypothetical protein